MIITSNTNEQIKNLIHLKEGFSMRGMSKHTSLMNFINFLFPVIIETDSGLTSQQVGTNHLP